MKIYEPFKQLKIVWRKSIFDNLVSGYSQRKDF